MNPRPDLVERARSLFPVIREHAIEAENARHLPAATVELYKQAGLVRTLMPARFGGHDSDWTTAFEVAIELGRADGSHAWCMCYWADHSWLFGHFPEQAQQEVWGENPDALIATSFVPNGQAEAVDGGYKLNGRWPFGSGITNSDYTILGGLIVGGDHPDFRLFLVPKGDYEIADVWHNAGLAATGSDDVILEDVFVPEHRAPSMGPMRDGGSDGSKVNPDLKWQVPVVSIFFYALLGPSIGAARGAFEAWVEESRTKVQTYTGEQVAELKTQQIAIGTIEAKIDAAETIARAGIARIESGEPVTLDVRVRNRRDFVYAMRTLVSALDDLMLTAGARSLFQASPIQRGWRDVHAIATHVLMNYDNAAENYGRHRLGQPLNPRDPFF